MSAATTVPHEFRREISPGRAAIPEAASRLLDLHHQYRSESSGSRLRGWWMQVHPIQLLGHRHKARMDADASWKIDPLSRRIASDRGHTLHHDLFRGSVIESHCESINCRITAVSKMYYYRIKNEEYQKKRKIAIRYIKKILHGRVHCCRRLETSIAN